LLGGLRGRGIGAGGCIKRNKRKKVDPCGLRSKPVLRIDIIEGVIGNMGEN
jgi:hypothetical protein